MSNWYEVRLSFVTTVAVEVADDEDDVTATDVAVSNACIPMGCDLLDTAVEGPLDEDTAKRFCDDFISLSS